MPPPHSNVRGIGLDAETRCVHYNKPVDIIAIKMKCCNTYYACKDCHEALTSHPIEVWPKSDWNQSAVLCGSCGRELSIREYMESDNHCPACKASFNPGCRTHYHLYFET